jgi:hypothetical protein
MINVGFMLLRLNVTTGMLLSLVGLILLSSSTISL